MPGARWMGLVVAGAALGCSQNPAPIGWLAPARDAQSDPYGAWIVVRHPGALDVAGEFLAVERDSVFVLGADSLVRAVSLDGSVEATIAFYDAQWGSLATWTTLGSVGTLSNGWFLIVTMPLWAVGGSLITGGQSRAPLVKVEHGASWDRVRRYARFPMGLPAELPRRLPPKPRPDLPEGSR